jgi:hypothetical protein
MPLIALKPFLDGQGRTINAGDALPDDYDQPTLDHYTRLGMVGGVEVKKQVDRTPAKDSKSRKENVTPPKGVTPPEGDKPPEGNTPPEGDTPPEA